MVGKYAGVLGSLFIVLLGYGGYAAEVGVAAKVNGAEITQAQLQRSFEGYLKQNNINIQGIRNPLQFKQLQKTVLDVLISQELLWQEAQNKKVAASDEEVKGVVDQIESGFPSPEAFANHVGKNGFTKEEFTHDVKRQLSVRQLINKEIAPSVSVSDEEIHSFYTANQNRFVSPEQVRARHILIKVKPDADRAAQEATKKTIDDIRAQAESGSDFAELAKKHSEDSSAARGGDLGFFSRGQMVPPFETAAFALKPGEISEVLKTRFGYHIIKMEEHREASSIPEEAVREEIRSHMRSVKIQEALEKRVEILRAAANVDILMPL
jgi:peptidyl-prolyl cis-trans isomerase C